MNGYDDPLLGKTNDRESDLRESEIRQRIRALLNEQPFAVLCTQGGGQPYGSVIAYAVGPRQVAAMRLKDGFYTTGRTMAFRRLYLDSRK